MMTSPPLTPRGRATGHLRQQLEGPLGGPEVREVDPYVGVDDADQGDVGEVQPLRDHLRAEQDLHLAALHPLQDPVVRPLPGGRVDVHPGDARGREGLADGPLDLLGADAPEADVLRAAAGAAVGRVLLVEAVVAGQPRAAAVVGQGDVAVRAVPDLAALAALHEGRVAAAVQQQDGLLPALHPEADRIDEVVGEHQRSGVRQGRRDRLPLPLPLGPQVDDADRRQRLPGGALRGSSISPNFPEPTLAQLSSEGVAEPSRQTAPSSCARTTATSRAW
jgi:hypothetical protein